METNEENLEALNSWCHNWFSNGLWYGNYSYVVEVGPDGDHPHVHAILEMKNSHKHADKLKKSWAKHFPNHQLLTSVDATTKAYKNKKKRGEYCYASFNKDSTDPEGNNILEDKLDYMINEKKSSHENLFETGFRGSRGF
jgi:hypothetical protein